MPDYTDNSLRASIKALEDVVAPALDPANPLASEQLRLVSSFLRFLLERRADLPVYEAAELAWHVDLLDALVQVLPPGGIDLRAAVRGAADEGRAALAGGAGATAPGAVSSRLATAASRAVHAMAEADDDARRRVERLVVERSGALLDLKRAWFAPYGFEAAPDRRPGLDSLVAPRRQP